jgi:hypothetical protein
VPLVVIAEDQVALNEEYFLPVVVHEGHGGERARLEPEQTRAAASLGSFVQVGCENLLRESGRVAGRYFPAVLHVDADEFEVLFGWQCHVGSP